MNTAHELLEAVRRDGAARFAATSLATDHAPLTRRVRRQRAVRTVGVSVASVGAAGALVFAVAHQIPAQLAPGVTTSPTNPASASPTPSVPVTLSVAVHKQERIEAIAADLAEAFGVTPDEALQALTRALPAEADANPEGWVLSGEYGFAAGSTLDDAAAALVGTMLSALESQGVPRERWLDTVVLASIVQQEAPAGSADQADMARLLLNRLDAGMKLQIESPLAYYLHADTELVGDDGWAVDTPFNTYLYEGLPPSAIGAATPEALHAAINPRQGDWLYFLRGEDGTVALFLTFEEYAIAVDEMYPGTGASD